MALKLIGGVALLVTGFVAWQICQTPQKLGLAEIVGDPASLATGSGAPGADHIPASLFTAGADPICSLAPEGYMPMQMICDGELAKVVFIPIDRMMGPETIIEGTTIQNLVSEGEILMLPGFEVESGEEFLSGSPYWLEMDHSDWVTVGSLTSQEVQALTVSGTQVFRGTSLTLKTDQVYAEADDQE